MLTPFSGGCACRAIRYECTVGPLVSWTCHCRDCQRASESVLCAPLRPQSRTHQRWCEQRVYGDSPGSGRTVSRGFCAECGSPVFLTRAYGLASSGCGRAV